MADTMPAGGTAQQGLPLGLTAFVGRTRERAQVADLLAEARLVTLTGAAGSGKTRLALEVARDVEPRFADGARWIDLAGLREPALVTAAVAAAVGVHERPSEGLLDTVAGRLRTQRLLLVLDNCEHLAAACAELVTGLLRSCPNIRVLATSREPVAVDGEVTVEVGPLPVPGAADATAAEVLVTDAARLFQLRARQARPDFAVTDDHAPAVAAICRRLDGLPLAIELAAARIRVLTPEQIAAGLSDRFRLLTGGARGALPRQQTLEASVRWSDELLADDERLALARLSVFAGSFDLEAAKAVIAGEGIDESAVLDLVTALAERSLVQVRADEEAARYRLLETIRHYARDRLAERDDPARVRDRHLDFHIDLAARAQAALTGPELEPWLARLSAGIDDLRAAMDWAMESQRPLAVLDVAEPTFTFWMVQGRYVEMHRRLRAAVNAPGAPDGERARGMMTASILALMGGDPPGGYRFADEAVPLAKAAGDDATLARALAYRAWCGNFSGEARSEQIRDDLDAAIALAEQAGAEETRLGSLMFAGTVDVRGRPFAEGHALLEQAVAEMEAGGLTYLLVIGRAFLAVRLALPAGEPERAREQARRAIEVGRRIGLQSFVSTALGGLASADMLQGDEDGARRHAAEALAVAQDSNLPTDEMVARYWCALDEHRFGTPEAAREAGEAALQAARDVGSREHEAQSAWLLGTCALREGRHAEARDRLLRARDLSVDPPYPFAFGRALLGLAALDGADGELDAAWEQAHEALEALAFHGERPGTADALEAIAGLALAVDRPEQTLRLLAAVDRFRADTGIGRAPWEAPRVESHRAEARARLDPETATACEEAGRALSLDEAVAYARRGRGARGRPKSGWGSLTPSERDVVRLVAEGCSNTEIAERLFVTVNTVKTHLSNVYAKVDVAGRADLAAEAARRDL